MSEECNNLCEEVVVRAATKQDMAPVAALIQELADFEEMSDGPKIGRAELEHDGFERDPPAFRCLVAELSQVGADRSIVGYALYFPIYSTWEGPTTMLEDLYVQPQHRRHGIGGKLFDAVAKIAAAAGSRLDFHVLKWNPAKEFYQKRGAKDITEEQQWCCFSLRDDALNKYASK